MLRSRDEVDEFNLFQFNFGLPDPGIFCRWFVPKWKCVGKDQESLMILSQIDFTVERTAD